MLDSSSFVRMTEERRVVMQHKCRDKAARVGVILMSAGWPEVAETHGINETIGITRELCQRDDVSIAASSNCDAEPRTSEGGSIWHLHPSTFH